MKGLAIAATFVSTENSLFPFPIGLLNPNGHPPARATDSRDPRDICAHNIEKTSSQNIYPKILQMHVSQRPRNPQSTKQNSASNRLR